VTCRGASLGCQPSCGRAQHGEKKLGRNKRVRTLALTFSKGKTIRGVLPILQSRPHNPAKLEKVDGNRAWEERHALFSDMTYRARQACSVGHSQFSLNDKGSLTSKSLIHHYDRDSLFSECSASIRSTTINSVCNAIYRLVPHKKAIMPPAYGTLQS
jgi:hypothetical protein